MHAHLTALFELGLFDPIIHLPLQLHAFKQPQEITSHVKSLPPGGEGISMCRKIPPPQFSSLG